MAEQLASISVLYILPYSLSVYQICGRLQWY